MTNNISLVKRSLVLMAVMFAPTYAMAADLFPSSYTTTSPLLVASAPLVQTWTVADEVDEAPEEEPADEPTVLKVYHVPVTAYTSSVNETDADPFVAADGSIVYDGMVAANFLPFGTKIRLPDYFGDKVFTVHDRMNTRYDKRIDIWTTTKSKAREWGLKKNVKIEVIEMGDNKHQWNNPEMKVLRAQYAKTGF